MNLESITAVRVGKYEITLVSVKGIPDVFPYVKDDLNKTLESFAYGEYGIEELERRLKAGEAQLWIIGEKGVKVVLLVVTRVIQYPKVKRLSIDLMTGEDMDGCSVMLGVAESWAAKYGCTEIEGYCRPGMRRAARKYGFFHKYEVIVKPIGRSIH